MTSAVSRLLSSLRSSLDEVVVENEKLQNALDVARDDNLLVLDELDALQTDYKSVREENSKLRCTDALQSDHAALESEHAELQSDHVALQSDHVVLQTEHAAIQSEHAVLQRDAGGLRGEYAALQSEYTALQSATGALQSEHAELQRYTGVLQSEHAALQSEHAASNSKLSKEVLRLMIEVGTAKAEHLAVSKELEKALAVAAEIPAQVGDKRRREAIEHKRVNRRLVSDNVYDIKFDETGQLTMFLREPNAGDTPYSARVVERTKEFGTSKMYYILCDGQEPLYCRSYRHLEQTMAAIAGSKIGVRNGVQAVVQAVQEAVAEVV